MKADYKRQIVEELEDIPEEDLSKIYEFIHWIRFKIIKLPQKETRANYDDDPLCKVIGCCEG